jgi:plastocyanin
MRSTLILAVLAALAASAAPASAADVTIQNFSFNPGEVTIAQGDTGTWHYAGPDTNHSVTADSGQADSWDSDPGGAPTSADHPPTTTYARRFDVAGTFTYHCQVHSSMHGKVTVTGAGEPAPAPAPDTTAPTVTRVSATGGRQCRRGARRCRSKPTVVRLKLSEDARVRVSAPGLSAVNRSVQGGTASIQISTRRLPPGRHRLTLTATDAAGNRSTATHIRVTVQAR